MDAPARVVHPLLVLALLALAVVGYLAGNRHVPAASSGQSPPAVTRSLSTAGLLIEYPAGWQRAATPAAIPGLELEAPVALAPGGGSGGGLLLGQLPAGTPAPLPPSFLARLQGSPHVEIVDLVSTQAYRYSGMNVRGWSGALDIYAIPAAGGGERVMACYGSPRLSAASQRCERIVANVSPTGPPAPDLTPEPIYARALSSVVDALQAERMQARKEMNASADPSAVASAASRLAIHLSSDASSLAALQDPTLAAAAGSALAASVRGASKAYAQLSQAASTESLPAYEAARTAVGEAEKSVDAALENFTLLGYGA
jgi:hypothetical protein